MPELTQELQQLCIDREVTDLGLELLRKAFESEPARLPRTSTLSRNIPIDFPSKKNGYVVRTESVLEAAYFLSMAFQKSNKLIIDQPKTLLSITYNSNNKKVVVTPTWDFIEVSDDYIGIVEVKPLAKLIKEHEKAPERYSLDKRNNHWYSKVIADTLKPYGLSFKYITEMDFEQDELDNYKFLLNYSESDRPLNYEAKLNKLLSTLKSDGQCTLEEALKIVTPPELLYYAICDQLIYYPLKYQSLINDPTNRQVIYSDEEYFKNVVSNTPQLGNESNNTLPRLTNRQLKTALKRLKILRDWENSTNKDSVLKQHNISKATVYRWRKQYIEGNNKFETLEDKSHLRGNRVQRYAHMICEIDELLTKYHKKPSSPLKKHTINNVKSNLIKKYGDACPSDQFLYARLKTLEHNLINVRQGAKRAYQESNNRNNEQKGTIKLFSANYFLARCHFDHTQTDIELVSENGINIGKPWLTYITDEYTGKILVKYLSFRNPSYITVMICLRLMVHKYGIVPSDLVVDGGKEFHCVSFDSFLASYHINRVSRKGKPRDGSSVERSFGELNTRCLHNLPGNTKLMKKVREVARTHQPRLHAKYTLEELDCIVETTTSAINHLKSKEEGLSPNQLAKISEQRFGFPEIQRVTYSHEFILKSLPLIKHRRQIKLRRNKSLHVLNKTYWNPISKGLPDNGIDCTVRYDPFDPNHVYAEIHGKYYEFKADHKHRISANPEIALKDTTETLALMSINKLSKPHADRKIQSEINSTVNAIDSKKKQMALESQYIDTDTATPSRSTSNPRPSIKLSKLVSPKSEIADDAP